MLGSAERNAGLGYPPTGRLRALKRLIGRVLWPFLRHQVDLNYELIEAFRASAADLQALSDRVSRPPEFDPRPKILELEAALDNLTAAVIRHEEPLHRFEEALAEHNEVLEQIQARIDTVDERIELTQRQAFSRYHDGEGALRRDIIDLNQQFLELQNFVDDALSRRLQESTTETLSKYVAELEELRKGAGSQIEGLRSAFGRRADAHSRALSDVAVRLALIDLRLAGPLPDEPRVAERGPQSGILVAAAHALGDRRFEARRRANEYLSHLDLKTVVGPILDLASEESGWLDVLDGLSVESYGLVSAPTDATKRSTRDFRAEDIFKHLRALDPASIGGVVATGLAEQLDLALFVELLELALVAVSPNGIVGIEANNPANRAGTSHLYRDPRTYRPLMPELLRFLVEGAGFVDVEVIYTGDPDSTPLPVPDPEETPWAKDVAAIAELLNRELLGPSHYAVIGRRP